MSDCGRVRVQPNLPEYEVKGAFIIHIREARHAVKTGIVALDHRALRNPLGRGAAGAGFDGVFGARCY
jgi:hypothetical protein